jgi:hypothetical protein
MSEQTRQQLCAELGISESTVRRLELDGLPFTPVGRRTKRYNLAEVKTWLREHQFLAGSMNRAAPASASLSSANAFTDAYRKVQLRVMPSK